MNSEMLLSSLGDEDFVVDVSVNLSAIYLGMQEFKKSSEYAEQALSLRQRLTGNEQTEDKGRALIVLGDIAQRMGDYQSAKSYYLQADKTFKVVGNHLESGRLLVSMARLAIAESKPILAKECIAEAQVLFEQLGARLDLRKLQTMKL